MSDKRRRPACWRTALAAVLAICLLAPAAAAASCPKTSLAEIDDEVMCPVCGTPLGAAGGPQAEDQREFIRDLADKCLSKEQIKAQLVAQYGDEVLALPKRDGFNATVYAVPAVAFLLAAALLLLAARRWRRDRRAGGDEAAAAPDGKRVSADMENYEL